MRTFTALAVTFVSLLAVFLGLSVLTVMIPRDALTDNIRSSAVTLHDEGTYPTAANVRFDNYSDAVMIEEAYGFERTSNPLTDALSSKLYDLSDPVNAIYNAYVKNKPVKEEDYARYWHGYAVFLRPLLVITDLSGIRVINYILLFTLAAITLILIYRRLPHIYFWGFLISLLAVDIIFVPQCMHYSSVFYITFTAAIAILAIPRISIGKTFAMCFFLAIGSLTSFFDLMTAPMMTWGIPLILFCAVSPCKSKIRAVIILSLCWIAGYALMWICKWILVAIFISPDIFSNALSSVAVRSFASDEITINRVHVLIIDNFDFFFAPVAIAAILYIAVATIALHKAEVRQYLRQYHYLLLIALGILAWYAATFQQSIIHLFFTRRAMFVIYYALIIWSYYAFVGYRRAIRTAAAPSQN